MVAAGWQQIPLAVVIYTAGLSNILPQYTEVAKIEGASFLQIVRYVIIPLLKPATVIVIVNTVVGSLQVFDLVYTMTQGGPFNSSNVLANYMYNQSFNNYRMGYGSAISVILLLLTLSFVVVYVDRATKKEIEY